jgi:hypothetical protein
MIEAIIDSFFMGAHFPPLEEVGGCLADVFYFVKEVETGNDKLDLMNFMVTVFFLL